MLKRTERRFVYEAYWMVCRFFSHTWWVRPQDWKKNVTWAYQRLTRGWSDRDTWSLDFYLDSWMPEALEHLKKTKHGIPIGMFTDEECKLLDGYTKSPECDAAQEAALGRWNVIMDKMIEGFKASRRVQDGTYQKELGEHTASRPAELTDEEWFKLRDERWGKLKVLMERDETLRTEGMLLFVEHYHSLWD